MGLHVDIKKTMQNFSLQVSFDMGCETLSILGASGSGKSMTLKCIAGIETPDEGSIVLDDTILFDSNQKINLRPQQRSIGYLFQNYALFPNMTVEENIAIGLKAGKQEKRTLVEEKIKSFYLEGLEKKKPSQLSGGQQQRVAIARMIASNPKIIMLDEPFSALDSYLRWEMEQEILDIIETYKKPTLFVSHNRDEVYRISDLIGVIDQGRLSFVSEKKDIFENPKTFIGAVLTGCKNFTRIKKVNEYKVYAFDWQINLITKEPVSNDIQYVGIRAHHIQVIDSNEESDNTMLCTVKKIIDNTFTTIILVEGLRNSQKNGVDKQHNYGEIRLEMPKNEWEKVKGNQVKLRFIPEALLLLE